MRRESPEKAARNLLDNLRRVRELRRGRSGAPRLAELDKATGYSLGHVRRQLQGKVPLAVEDLYTICDLLGASLEELVEASYRGLPPLEVYLGELARLERKQLRLLRPPQGAMPPSDLEAALHHLDELLRLGQPEAADRRAYLAALHDEESLLEFDAEVAGKLLFRTWDLLGASFRNSAHYSASAHCYMKSLRLCSYGSRDHAHVLRRACYLATDQCAYDEALFFSAQAQEIYLHWQETKDLGRAMIDAAIVFHRGAWYQKAINGFQNGLKLAGNDMHYSLAAHQCMGLSNIYQKKSEIARQNLADAQKIYRAMKNAGPRQEIGLHWLAAEIALVEEDFLTAKTLFLKVRKSYDDSGKRLDYAAAGIRLAKTYLLLGDLEGVETVVRESTALIQSMSRFKFAATVLWKLHHLAAEKELSVKELDRLFFQFKKQGSAIP